MKILLIDNNIMTSSWGAHDLKRLVLSADPRSTVYVRRGPHNDLPKNLRFFDKVVLSGSITSAMDEKEWIQNLENLILESIEKKIPVLGVCYGHQMIARALGGKTHVRKAQTPEFGWTEVEITNSESILLKGLPKKFHSYSSHFDEVHVLPPDLNITSKSAICSIQSYESKTKPIFGIQFHPERNLEEAKCSYIENKKKGLDKFHLNHDKGHKLYNEAIGKTIFNNFLKL